MRLPNVVGPRAASGEAGWLRDLLAADGGGLLACDASGRIAWVDAAAARLLGRQERELIGLPLGGELLGAGIEAELELARISARPRVFDFHWQPQDRWLEFRAAPRDGELLLALRDVTARRVREAETAASEARLKALVEMEGQWTWRLDRQGNTHDSSSIWDRFTGRPREESLGDRWLELVHPDDRARVLAEHGALLANPRVWRSEYRLRRHDGVYRRFAVRIAPVYGPDGEVREFIGASQEIEERHRTELERQELIRALDRKNERLAAIFEALPVGVLLAEAPSGRILQTNRTFRLLTGTETPALDSALPCPTTRCIRDGLPVEGEELSVPGPGGTTTWLRVSAVPLRDDAGKVIAGLATAVDISERKRMEEALRASEAEFRFCLESLPQLVWIAAPDGTITYCNERFQRATGLSAVELLGDGWAAAVHPDDRARCLAGWAETVARGVALEEEVRFRQHDGSWRWYLTRALPIRDGEGRITRWFGTNTDIDEIKRIREALESSQARFQRIAELGLLGMFTWRLTDARVLDANAEFLRLLGYDEDDLRAGRIDWWALSPPELHQLDHAIGAELLRDGSLRPTEREYVRKDGSRVPVVVTAALDAPGSETGFTFLFDASERKQLEEFQRQLIGVVSHDLRSPLAAMLTTTNVLLRKGELPEHARKGLERIRVTAERMRRITRDLLDYTQARVGAGLQVDPAPTEIGALCRAVVAESRLLAPDRPLRLEGEGPEEVSWDRARIEQALSNLLSNAVKYGTGAVALRWRSAGDQVAIEVENEGEPIDTALLPHLFQPFRQGTRREPTVTQSLGLGLYIVRAIVEAHGGEATIEPRPGGTLVRLVLPREATGRDAENP